MHRSLAKRLAERLARRPTKRPTKRPVKSLAKSLAMALALGLWASAAVPHGAAAQGMMMPPGQAAAPGMMMPPGQAAAPGGPQCGDFIKLRDDTEKKAAVINVINKSHGDRKDMCAAVTKFTAAEALVVKFLEDNKTWCGIPDEAVTNAKAGHEKTIKFRDTVCAEGPKPKIPTLSDAIGTPSLDTAKNTRTGPGTFDTLTGNPLAK
jgi:hypothetical protein